MDEPMHCARLALLEGALLALLRELAHDPLQVEKPDEVCAILGDDGLTLEYYRAGMPIAGKGRA